MEEPLTLESALALLKYHLVPDMIPDEPGPVTRSISAEVRAAFDFVNTACQAKANADTLAGLYAVENAALYNFCGELSRYLMTCPDPQAGATLERLGALKAATGYLDALWASRDARLITLAEYSERIAELEERSR